VLEGLSEGVVFPEGDLMPPTDLFHKKSVVLAPGSFEHVQPFYPEMLRCGIEELSKEPANSGNNVLGLFCLSSVPVTGSETIAVEEVLRRIEALQTFGYGALLIRDREVYKMSALVKRFTQLPVRLVAGITLLVRALTYEYDETVGGRLEGISRLFAQHTKVYAYPMPEDAVKDWIKDNSIAGWDWSAVNGWVTADQLRLPPPLVHLYNFVLAAGLLVPLQHATACVDISSATSGS
jgi:hypothetical protein